MLGYTFLFEHPNPQLFTQISINGILHKIRLFKRLRMWMSNIGRKERDWEGEREREREREREKERDSER